MQVLVMIEPDLKNLSKSGRAMVAAALRYTTAPTVLVVGKDQTAIATEAAKIPGVAKVLFAPVASLLAEEITETVLPYTTTFDVFLAPASTFGKNVLPRIAAKLGVAQVSDVIQINDDGSVLHPIYAGNAIEQVALLSYKKVLTIRPTAFQPVVGVQAPCEIETVAVSTAFQKTRILSYEAHLSKRPELTQASVIVSGGRALQSAEKFKLIDDLADCLGAAVGASRAAVDAGFVPNDYQVGQTGKIVAPTLYIAIGISGAIQHLAGMQEAKVIVAINKDPDAPIFQVATYGLVGDLFELVPQLIRLLKAGKEE